MTRRSDFRKALADVLRLAAANEQRGVLALQAAIRELRAQLADRITRGDINAATISRLLVDVEALIEQTGAQMAAIADQTIRQAGQYGADSVLEPLLAINAPLATTSQLQRLAPLVGHTVDLIVGGLTADMRSAMRRALRINALGEASPNDAMQAIDRILGQVGRGGRTKTTGVYYDAERILRTETGRTFNITAADTLKQAAQDDPNVKKRWVNPLQPTSRPSHVAAHMETLANPISANEPFIVDGEALMYPLDPNGSAKNTINCGCRILTVYDDLGVVLMPGETRRFTTV